MSADSQIARFGSDAGSLTLTDDHRVVPSGPNGAMTEEM